MTTSLQQWFLTYLDEHLASLVEEWHYALAQFSQAAHQADKTRLQQCIITLLCQQGMSGQMLDTAHIYSESPVRDARTLLLCSQCEDQPTDAARWGIFVARLLTLAIYQRVTGVMPTHVKWLVALEKPTSFEAMERFTQNFHALLQADGCLYDLTGPSPLATPLLALGAKGHLSVLLEVRGNATSQASLHGAILPNAAWRLTWALASLKDVREEVLVDGFYDTLTPAEDDEIELLYAAQANDQNLARYLGTSSFLLGLQGFQLRYTHLLTPSCTVTGMRAGEQGNNTKDNPQDNVQHTIPAYARAYVDFHLVPGQAPDDILAKLRHHLDTHGFHDVQIRTLSSSRPIQTRLRSSFAQTILRATHNTYGGSVPIVPLTPESTLLYPLHEQLEIPVVIAQMGYSEDRLHMAGISDTSDTMGDLRQQLAICIKHTAMILEEMAHAKHAT